MLGMKKNLPLILLGFSLLPLSSCNPTIESVEKVVLDYGTIRFDEDKINASKKSQMEQIDIGELNDLISKKANFVLMLGNAFDCSCWTSFHNDVLAPYLLEKHIYLPWISYDEGSKTLSELGAEVSKSHETLMIFKEGKIAYQHTTSDVNSSWVKELSAFRTWMNARIEEPRLLTLSKEQLNAKYAGSAAFSIVFSRSTCPDCSFLVDNDVKSYFASHIKETKIPENYLYLLDCDVEGIRYVKGDDGKTYSPSSSEDASDYQKQAYEQWTSFKEEYGLSYSESNPAGWEAGFVPTVYHITPNGSSKTGDVIDYSGVFYNETADEESGIIASSYFSKKRQSEACASLEYLYCSDCEYKCLEGLSYDKTKDWHEALQIYERPILNLLLDAIL